MAKRWIAVERHDGSECKPCEDIDGTVYRNRADAYADYPGGVGYKNCIGAQYGNACRGKVQKRRGHERTNSGMTDTRLLNEFRARLAERAALHRFTDAIKGAPPRKPGADWFRIENLSAEEASIYIYDEIGFWGTSAQGFVDQLNAITSPKITVHINSPGGEVFDGIAIHTALATSKAHVTTFITGVAASAASYIAMAGDTIKMARNATMMLHDASGLCWGNATTMRTEADLLDKLTMLAWGSLGEDIETKFWLSLVYGGSSNAMHSEITRNLFGLHRLLAIINDIDASPEGLDEELLKRTAPTPKTDAAQLEAPAPEEPEPLTDVQQQILSNFRGEDASSRATEKW